MSDWISVMLSRGNSSASARLRRAKSSASVKSRNTALELTPFDPETARQHAQIAASVAFGRAHSRMKAAIQDEAVLTGGYSSQSVKEEGQKLLRKEQSVRFTGYNAVSSRQSSITRRTALGFGNKSFDAQQVGRVETMTPLSDMDLSALPPVSSISSTPSSYRKLRKAKSMYTPRGGPLVTFANATPKNHELLPQRYRRLSSDEYRSPPKMADPRKIASLSQQRYQPPYDYDQDAAIQLARDQYLRQLEKQRLTKQPSLLSMRKRRESQKILRKTVRTSSTNSSGNAVESSCAGGTFKKAGLGIKARNLSVTIKRGIKRVLKRYSDDEPTFPDQQVEAQRLHYGNYLSATSGLDHDGPRPPVPNGELLSRNSSRASSIHRMPVYLDRKTSPASIRSVRTSPSGDKSRTTSWTKSIATSSLTKQQLLLEKKRLSIIQENGGPHQPSSSAGRIGIAARKGYAVFRKPLRGSSSAGKAREPVDSQRIFSALQKRLDEHASSYRQDTNANAPFGAESLTSRRSSQELEYRASEERQSHDTTVRLLPRQSSGYHPESRTIRPSRFMNFDAASSTDDMFRPSPGLSNLRKAVKMDGDLLEGRLTYQQIAERNERSEGPKGRSLREVKSAFFPSTAYYHSKNISPYRRALQSSIDEESGNEEKDTWINSGHELPSRQSQLTVPFESALSSSSVYSRSPHETPQRPEASSSDRILSKGEGPVTATIMDKTPPYFTPLTTLATRRKVSIAESSGEWKGWLASEVASLERNRNPSSQYPGSNGKSSATHRKEHAQIDSDDVQISTQYKWGPLPQQSLAELRNEMFRPPLTHKTSDQMVEKFPLRFPLIERTTSSGTTTTIKRNTGMPVVTNTPSAAASGLLCSTSQSKQGNQHSSPQAFLEPGDLHKLVAERSVGTRENEKSRRHILADSTNSNMRETRNALGKIQTQSSTNLRSRHSPERAERLRRMQSSNAMNSKENVRSPGSRSLLRSHCQERQEINDSTPLSSPGLEQSVRGAGIVESVTAGLGSEGSQKMIEHFLEKRKNAIASGGGSSPVFI